MPVWSAYKLAAELEWLDYPPSEIIRFLGTLPTLFGYNLSDNMPATREDWDMKITTSEPRDKIVQLAKGLVAAEDEVVFDNIAEALVEEIQAADESGIAEGEEELSPEVAIEVFGMVNSEGDYEVGKNMEEVTARFDGYDVEAVDTYHWKITLPRPKVIEGEARISGEDPTSVVRIDVE
jgi:hypothetical protein